MKEWWEVNYTDTETLFDYKTDISAETPEEARRIFEEKTDPRYKVWAVYGK